MRRPALIATDLDGTFLGAGATMIAANVDAVLAAAEAGVPIAVATGRPIRWLPPLDAIAPAHPHLIASNGALIYDLASASVERAWPLADDVIAEVTRDLRRELPGIAFGLEQIGAWAHEHDYCRAAHVPPPDRIGVLGDLLGERPTIKLLASHPELTSAQLHEAAAPVIGERLNPTWSFFGDHGLLEVSAAGVSKASALAELCSVLGIDPNDAVAFGDMPNDLEMLRFVGRGFVVANGHPDLLAMGFTQVPSNLEAGVGVTIRRLIDRRALRNGF